MFLRIIWILVLVTFFVQCNGQKDISKSTIRTDVPNIIVIVTDDQRWDAIGYAGNEIIQTPHMDALAEKGVYFANAFVTTPICAASRASILSGMYERRHGYTFGTEPFQKEHAEISYPMLLKDSGYRTGLFGKLGVNFEERMDTVVFDELYNTGTQGYFRLKGKGAREHIHLTDHTTNLAMEFIDETPKGQPFCLSISYNAPHADDASPQQYFWPERHDTLYRDVNIPFSHMYFESARKTLPDFLKDSLYLGNARYLWRFNTIEKYQKMVKGYYRMITTIDDNIGRLREHLVAKGLSENTIIILIGDNGYFLGERGLAGKWLMYENSLRVPLVIYDPREEARITRKEMVLNIDLAPTIAEYAGVPAPALYQGKSLAGLTSNDPAEWRESFLVEHHFDIDYIPKSEGIRTDRWKYFRYFENDGHDELYDLYVDPYELKDLSEWEDYEEVKTQLIKELNTLINTKN